MGRRTAKPLTAVAVTRIGPGLHSDGHVAGLYLAVGATGSRSWVYRYSIAGRRRDMGLGSASLISLAKARELATVARQSVYIDKIDPLGSRRAGGNTFAEIAERYITDNRAGWRNAKHADQWSATLEKYAYPVIGNMAVDKITTADVKRVLDPIWSSKTETATRVRQRIEAVLDSAKAQGLRTGDNAAAWGGGNLESMLPKPSKVATVKSHAAMPYAEVPVFMVRLRAAEGTAARMLELAILCASRSNEVRGARWDEIDIATATWIIPGKRMKGGRIHRVALSPRATELLKSLPRDPEQPLVFLSPTGRKFSDASMAAVLKRLKVVNATQHGFRASFRTWTTEQTGFPSDAAEFALAHLVGNETERAYARSDMLEIRRELMAAWSEYLEAKS